VCLVVLCNLKPVGRWVPSVLFNVENRLGPSHMCRAREIISDQNLFNNDFIIFITRPSISTSTSNTGEGFSWLSLQGKTLIHEIIQQRLPQWSNGPRDSQVNCWAHNLECIPTISIASTAYMGSLWLHDNGLINSLL
jgi:hypothetical protein